jgi:hypothetical protein
LIFLELAAQRGTPSWGAARRADFGSAIIRIFAVTGLVLALPSTATRARPFRATFRAKLNAPDPAARQDLQIVEPARQFDGRSYGVTT